MKYLFTLCLLIFALSGCTTIPEKEDEIKAKILFDSLLEKSSKLKSYSISGKVRISGVPEIPPVYLNFDLISNLNTETGLFRISFLNKKLVEIIIEKDLSFIINETKNEYVILENDNLDLSKITGINFSANQIGYLLLGLIPFENNMEYMGVGRENNKTLFKSTSTNSQYLITVDSSEKIEKIEVINNIFDNIVLDNIKYNENNAPKLLTLQSEEKNIKLNFNITSIKKNIGSNIFNKNKLKNYLKIDNIKDLQITLN